MDALVATLDALPCGDEVKEPLSMESPEAVAKVDETKVAPATGIFHQVAKWLPRLCFVLLLVTAVDLLIFYKTFQRPTFRQIDIFLEPTEDSSNSESSFIVQGNMKKASLTMSVDSSGATCEFFYRALDTLEYAAIGQLEVTLPSASNSVDTFDIRGQFPQLDYPILREVYFDLINKAMVTSQVKVVCAVEVQATLYRAVPVQNTFHLQQELFLEPIRKQLSKSKNVFTYSEHKKLKVEEDDDIVHQAGKENAKHITMQSSLKHASLYAIQYELLIRLNKNFKPDPSIQSLVLHVPKISYVTAFVDKAGAPKSYLRIKAKPFLVDFAKVPELVDIDLSVGCTPYDVYEGNRNVSSTSSGDCTLIAPFDLDRFKYEYQHNGFVNITSRATHLNFITKFVGASHYIRTIPANDANKGMMHHPQPSVAATRALTTTDPAISTGSDCIEVDTDGIYFSQACSVVEKGFFMLGVSTFTADGYLGFLRSTTSWAPSGPLAFSSELVGNQLNFGELAANVFFSETFQNLTLFTFFNYTEGVGATFTESLSCAWDLHNTKGDLHVKSLTIVDAFAPVLVVGDLAYANSNYTADLIVGDGFNTTVEAMAIFSGEGRYGGNWNKWWATLDESTYYYDLEYQGGAIGEVSYDVQSNGAMGEIIFTGKATDNVHADYVVSNFTGGWYSDQSWTADGSIYADYYLDIVPEPLVVNVTSAFHYGEHAFLLGANMGLNAEPQYVAVKGLGGYGGSWSRFHSELVNSTLVYDGDVVGHAVAAVAFYEADNGADVGVSGSTRVVDGDDMEVFQSASGLAWFTQSAWGQNGNIVLNSLLSVEEGEGLNWNVTSAFQFSEGNYSLHVYENMVNATSAGFVCDAVGTYVTKYYDWAVDLKAASCASNGEDLGLVSAATHIVTDSMVETLRVFYELEVFDGEGEPVLASQQSIQAFPSASAASTDDDNTIYISQQIYVYEYLYNVDYQTYAVNASANNEAIQTAMRICFPDTTGETFQNFQVYNYVASEIFSSYYLLFNRSSSDGEGLANIASDCFLSGAYYTNLMQYIAAHPNASGLSTISSVSGGSYSMSYDDDYESYQSPWVYTGHIHVDSFWNLTDTLMWNVSAALDYVNNSYHVFLAEENKFKDNAATSLFTFGKGEYEGSTLDWTVTLNESALVVNKNLVGSASGVVAGLTTYNGQLNFSATAFDAEKNVVLQTEDQVSWRTETNYDLQGTFGLTSQMFISDTLTWNVSSQAEYGHHNYSVLFYDNNIYDTSDDVIVSYAAGSYGGSFPMDWYATLNQCFVTFNGELEANVKGKITVDIADNGTVGTLGFELLDYDTWMYYSDATAYHFNETVFATENYISYKYDGEVAGGKFMTNTQYDSAPLFLLASELEVDLSEDTASLIVYETLQGEEGVNLFGNAKYDMDTGMIASMQVVLYYNQDLIYGFNTNYDMQLENYNNSDATGRPSYMPTIMPTLSPSAIPTIVPSANPTQSPTFSPSVVPTLSPSAAPSATPTTAPTASPTATVIITATPTKVPTIAPSTPPDATVEFVASQVISGISFNTYSQNKDANDQAIKASIADCMVDISANDVTNLIVAEARRLRLLLVVNVAVQGTTDSIQTTYTILSTNPTLSFDTLSSQLQQAVDNGNFNSYLTQNAAAIPGASALTNCTSAAVDTTDTLPPTNNDDGDVLSDGAIAGIVIGVVVFVALIASCVYWQLFMKGSSASNTTAGGESERTSSTAPVKAMPDVEMSSESEVKWTENIARKA